MLSRRPAGSLVFFPWENRRGILGALGRRRARVLVLFLGLALAIALLYESGERRAAIRATRATLTTVSSATAAYRADHGGACPRAVGDLLALGYTHADPVDAWGHALRLACPGRRDPLAFDLSSDGPDGLPGGLDEVR